MPSKNNKHMKWKDWGNLNKDRGPNAPAKPVRDRKVGELFQQALDRRKRRMKDIFGE